MKRGRKRRQLPRRPRAQVALVLPLRRGWRCWRRAATAFTSLRQTCAFAGRAKYSGQAGLPPLRYADLLRDIDLLQIARREATALLARDPALENPEHKLMKQVLKERWESAAITLE